MMNTPKHTPGPWHLSECATQTTKAGIVSADGLHITDICGYGMTDSQNQANAHLIAAAPAMYEALSHAAVSTHHPSCKCKGEYSANPERYCTCHVQKARTALAQAEAKS